MMLRSFTLLSSALAAASANMEVPTGNIAASSKLGAKVLSQARQLDNDNKSSWVVGYSLKFEKCGTSDEYYSGFGGDGDGDENNNQYYNGYKQRLIHFKLCPTESCSSKGCSNGADYVIDMNVFVAAYIESKLEAQEYNCEMVQENCNCENANDEDRCEYQCYLDAGLDYCEQDDNDNQNENQFELEEAAQCGRLEVDEDALAYYYYENMGQNGNNNNGQQQYYNNNQNNGEQELYVGPYCTANGKQIYLGVFWDESCSSPAPDGIYEQLNYGNTLPYTSESLIEEGCVSCLDAQEANDDDDGDDEVLEMCEQLYENSGKCENGLADGVTYYPNSYACDFISSLKSPGKMSTSKSSVSASNVFVGLFVTTTAIFGGVAFYFFKKAQRNNVNLAGQGGAMA